VYIYLISFFLIFVFAKDLDIKTKYSHNYYHKGERVSQIFGVWKFGVGEKIKTQNDSKIDYAILEQLPCSP